MTIGLLSSPANAFTFEPYHCGSGKGAPLSASHFHILTEHVLAYPTLEAYLMLDCRSKSAIIVHNPERGSKKYETWGHEQPQQEIRNISRDMICSETPVGFQDAKHVFEELDYEVTVRGSGLFSYRFGCICRQHYADGHGRIGDFLSWEDGVIAPAENPVKTSCCGGDE